MEHRLMSHVSNQLSPETPNAGSRPISHSIYQLDPHSLLILAPLGGLCNHKSLWGSPIVDVEGGNFSSTPSVLLECWGKGSLKLLFSIWPSHPSWERKRNDVRGHLPLHSQSTDGRLPQFWDHSSFSEYGCGNGKKLSWRTPLWKRAGSVYECILEMVLMNIY